MLSKKKVAVQGACSQDKFDAAISQLAPQQQSEDQTSRCSFGDGSSGSEFVPMELHAFLRHADVRGSNRILGHAPEGLNVFAAPINAFPAALNDL
ncbi:MAG: hypothetical protein EON84_13265 [Bradyrhizobiaceae bacterium]|nr:MAG: hypothetical protein EON84_13265 [Bradyrhizobiaceae bacterium]